MKALTTNDQFSALVDALGEAKERFYGSALLHTVAFKVCVGRLVSRSPLKGKYGEGFIPRLSEETGISESVIKDAVLMYEHEKLRPKSEKQFIMEFQGKYASWREYLAEGLGRGQKAISDGALEPQCRHCLVEGHCPPLWKTAT